MHRYVKSTVTGEVLQVSHVTPSGEIHCHRIADVTGEIIVLDDSTAAAWSDCFSELAIPMPDDFSLTAIAA